MDFCACAVTRTDNDCCRVSSVLTVRPTAAVKLHTFEIYESSVMCGRVKRPCVTGPGQMFIQTTLELKYQKYSHFILKIFQTSRGDRDKQSQLELSDTRDKSQVAL